MALTSNNFINTWIFGANDVVGIEIPQTPVNPDIGTFGYRSIGVPVTTCTAGDLGLAYLTSVNGDANRANSEVLVCWQVKADAAPMYRSAVIVRGSGTTGAANGYLTFFVEESSVLLVAKFVAGTLTVLGSLSVTLPGSPEDWFTRFRVNGTTLRARTWRYDAVEPTTWGIDVTDSDLAGVGYVGFVSACITTNQMGFGTPGFISVGTNGESAPLPKSDLEQRNWVNDDSNTRVLLAEVGVLAQDDVGAAVSGYALISTAPFVTHASDSPPNQVYDDVMAKPPTFSSRASEQLTGRSTQSVGDVLISNGDGARDHWLTYNWDGRSFDMYLGGVGWRKWDFIKVLSATVYEAFVPARDMLGLKIRDKSALLNRKIQDTVIGGTTANKGTPTPITFGKVFNIEPVMIDAATYRYKFHDQSLSGAVGIIDVRDSGVSVAYTDQGNGEFTLNASPTGSGRITMDANVDVSAGSAVKAGGQHNNLLQTLVEDRAGFGAGACYKGLRSGSLATFGAVPADLVGLYLRQETSFMDELDRVVLSGGGSWNFDRLGLFSAWLMRVPTGDVDHMLSEDDIEGFKVDKVMLPSEVEQLGFQGNWTPQPDGLAGAVTPINRALYAAPAQYTTISPSYSTLDQPANHALRLRPVNRDTLLYQQAAAIAEAERQDGIYRRSCALVSFETKVNSIYYNLGQSLKLTYPRLGFELGRSGVIVGLEDDFGRVSTRITLFVQIVGQFPVVTAGTPFVTAADFYRPVA